MTPENVCMILDLEGYFVEKTFRVRELGYYTWQEKFGRHAFYMRMSWCNLSSRDRKTVSYVKYNVHGLTYQPRKEEKAYEYYRVEEVMWDLYEETKTPERTVVAYKGGHVERDLLNKLNIPSVNLELYGCPKYDGASTSGEQRGIQSQEDSEEEMDVPFEFQLRAHVDRRVRRFGLHIRNFTGRFVQTGGGAGVESAPLGPRPVLVQQIARALQRAVQQHILDDGAVGDDDHLLININSNRIQNAFHSRRLTVGEWRENTVAARQLLKQISDMLNSNQTFQVDDTFNLNVSHIQNPGRGGDRQKYKPGI
ncbi:hypothetical protein ACROYT_G002289 [Oculina patagonica]